MNQLDYVKSTVWFGSVWFGFFPPPYNLKHIETHWNTQRCRFAVLNFGLCGCPFPSFHIILLLKILSSPIPLARFSSSSHLTSLSLSVTCSFFKQDLTWWVFIFLLLLLAFMWVSGEWFDSIIAFFSFSSLFI